MLGGLSKQAGVPNGHRRLAHEAVEQVLVVRAKMPERDR
jgi:hypothetical protein